MLLLSSATRILATKHPPTIPHPCMPRQPQRGHTESSSPMYWSILPGRRQRQRVKRVSEMNTVPQPPEPPLRDNTKGARNASAPPFHSPLLVLNGSYQGTIFRSPFFFLLLDSFFLSSFAPVWVPSWAGVASALAASLGGAAPAAASVLGVPSPVPATSVPPPFAESVTAGGALGSAGASAFGVLPSVGAATFSAAPAVPLLPPGVTVATIPVPVPGFLVWSPPVKISTPADVSDSGSNVGFPTREATCSSCPGPVLKNPSGFFTRLVRGGGAFCSAVIHATAFGSGCGTGAPSAFNRSFASGTRGDSG